MIPVPKGILDSLGKDMTGKDIEQVVSVVMPLIKDTVMFMKEVTTSKDVLRH